MTKKTITQLSYEITGCAIKVHRALGPGLLESVYEKCLKYELIRRGYEVAQQVFVPVIYEDMIIDTELRFDLLVNDCIVVELKAIQHVLPVHEAKLLTYYEAAAKTAGLTDQFLYGQYYQIHEAVCE